MLFKVIDNCRQNAGYFDDNKVDFLLEYDYWNDYSYRTTYHVHATSKLTRKGTRYLGFIKIMKKGQTTLDSSLLKHLYQDKGGVFSQLPDDFVSVSFSLELYQSIVHLLESQDLRLEFATALRMLFDAEDPRYPEYSFDECFTTSLLRDTHIDHYILRKGKQLIYNEAAFYDLEKKKLTVNYVKSGNEIELDFTPISEAEGVGMVPYGVIAFIGQNGCGKSTFLYQLAKLLYLSPTERFLMKDIVKVEPNDVGISKLFMFSYSAFDNFMFPGSTLSDYMLMAEGVANREGRFVYCGVRDVSQEIQNLIDETQKKLLDKEEEKKDYILVQEERMPRITLKPLEKLAHEFEDALYVINRNEETTKLWKNLGSDCKEILPGIFSEIEPVFCYDPFERIDYVDAFLKYSTGIKFFLHTMSHIYAYNEDNSLLLFDEPENHLHPPMLSFMMNHIREAIRRTHSVMLIATHSPVILQELFSRNVYVIRQNGESIVIKHPETETYGENFGYINNLVFRLNSDVSLFHKTFEKLFEKWQCKNCKDEEEVIQVFQDRLGCETLSCQMISFLVNLYQNPKID